MHSFFLEAVWKVLPTVSVFATARRIICNRFFPVAAFLPEPVQDAIRSASSSEDTEVVVPSHIREELIRQFPILGSPGPIPGIPVSGERGGRFIPGIFSGVFSLVQASFGLSAEVATVVYAGVVCVDLLYTGVSYLRNRHKAPVIPKSIFPDPHKIGRREKEPAEILNDGIDLDATPLKHDVELPSPSMEIVASEHGDLSPAVKNLPISPESLFQITLHDIINITLIFQLLTVGRFLFDTKILETRYLGFRFTRSDKFIRFQFRNFSAQLVETPYTRLLAFTLSGIGLFFISHFLVLVKGISLTIPKTLFLK